MGKSRKVVFFYDVLV